MKKLVMFGLAAVLGAGLFSGVAAATDNAGDRGSQRCEIHQTGPESTNTCGISDEVVVVCDNDNEVVVNTDNDQDAESGDAENNGNTSGGNSTTGDTINRNSTIVESAIENNCGEVAAANKPEDKEKPGKGAGPVKKHEQSAKPQAQAQPAALPQPSEQAVSNLPNTAGLSPAAYVGVAALSLGAIALAARFGLAAYALFKA